MCLKGVGESLCVNKVVLKFLPIWVNKVRLSGLPNLKLPTKTDRTWLNTIQNDKNQMPAPCFQIPFIVTQTHQK